MSKKLIVPEETYSGKQMSNILGIDDTWFAGLVRNRIIRPVKNTRGEFVRGRYTLEAVAQFVRWLLGEKKTGVNPAQQQEVIKTEKMAEERDHWRMRNDILRRKLVYFVDFEIAVGNVLVPIRNAWIGFPNYVSSMLEEKSRPEITEILTREIERLLEDLRPPTLEEVVTNRPRREQVFFSEEHQYGSGNGNREEEHVGTNV